MGYTENEFARLPDDLQRKDPDVVKVVRCKDCKYWDYGDCYRIELTRPEDFCSYGERDETDSKQ